MLESLSSLAYGFNIALQPQNLLYCFIGVTMGTLVGVLPPPANPRRMFSRSVPLPVDADTMEPGQAPTYAAGDRLPFWANFVTW